MLTRWNNLGLGRWGEQQLGDLDQTFASLDTLRRDMNRWFADVDQQLGTADRAGTLMPQTPRLSLSDRGSALLLRAELPGFDEKDIDIKVHGTTLTISGTRKIEVPEGYSAHRRERRELSFSRSATLPTKVEPDQAQAVMRDGVLELTLPKTPESQPRQIAIKSS